MDTEKKKAAALRAVEGFNARAFTAHHPEIMCITCIDGRERAGGLFDFDDNAVRVTEIGAVIPPYETAPHNTRAKFSFRKMKGISTIQLNGHSFCGGAQTVIAFPDLDQIEDPEVRDVVQSIADSGADLPRLRDAFLKACEGDASHAANLLSRHLVLVSLDNISGYPYINDQIVDKKLDVLPLYHDLKEGSGALSELERYDVALQMWSTTSLTPATHMCDRPNDCGNCSSCHATIETSWHWAPVLALVDGKVEMVEVPRHIATLLEQKRDMFQPGLHKALSDVTPAPAKKVFKMGKS